jgi:hypothetical protein
MTLIASYTRMLKPVQTQRDTIVKNLGRSELSFRGFFKVNESATGRA